jgi:hypothetical protein
MRYPFVIVTAGVGVVLGLVAGTVLDVIIPPLFARVSGLLTAALFVGTVFETVHSQDVN